MDRPPIWDEGYTTGEASNSVHLNSSQQVQQKQRNTYGAYFKEELKKILDGRETNTDIHTSNQDEMTNPGSQDYFTNASV